MVSFGNVIKTNISDLRIVEAKIVSNYDLGHIGVIAGNVSEGSIVDCITSGEVIGNFGNNWEVCLVSLVMK